MQSFQNTLNHYHHRHWASSSPPHPSHSNITSVHCKFKLSIFTKWISYGSKSPNKCFTSQFAWFLILLSRKLPTSWKWRKKSWREHNVLWTFSLFPCTLHRSPSTYASTHAISLKLNDSLIRWTILVSSSKTVAVAGRRSQVQLSNSSELVWRRKKIS